MVRTNGNLGANWEECRGFVSSLSRGTHWLCLWGCWPEGRNNRAQAQWGSSGPWGRVQVKTVWAWPAFTEDGTFGRQPHLRGQCWPALGSQWRLHGLLGLCGWVTNSGFRHTKTTRLSTKAGNWHGKSTECDQLLGMTATFRELAKEEVIEQRKPTNDQITWPRVTEIRQAELHWLTVRQSELPVSVGDGPSGALPRRVSSATHTEVHLPSSEPMYELFIAFLHWLSSLFAWTSKVNRANKVQISKKHSSTTVTYGGKFKKLLKFSLSYTSFIGNEYHHIIKSTQRQIPRQGGAH